ncbi:hypothetical protein KBD34_02425 [Patescibacteria group bacterium]|nr:hypothetical protein [Patescibacteria group bacterium]
MKFPNVPPAPSPEAPRKREPSATLLQKLMLAALATVSADVAQKETPHTADPVTIEADPATTPRRSVHASTRSRERAPSARVAPIPSDAGSATETGVANATETSSVIERSTPMSDAEKAELDGTIDAFFDTEFARDEDLNEYFGNDFFHFRDLERRVQGHVFETVYSNEKGAFRLNGDGFYDYGYRRENYIGRAMGRALEDRARDLLERRGTDSVKRAIQICVYSMNWRLAGEFAYQTHNGEYFIQTWRQYDEGSEMYLVDNHDHQRPSTLHLFFRRSDIAWVRAFAPYLEAAERAEIISGLEQLHRRVAENGEATYGSGSLSPGGFCGLIEGEDVPMYLARLQTIMEIVRSQQP